MKTLDEMIAVMQAAKTKVIRARRIYSNSKFGDWFTPRNPQWDWSTHEYEVVPEPKRVPLGPEDVPPGSIMKPGAYLNTTWRQVVAVWSTGVTVIEALQIAMKDWPSLMEQGWVISRDGGKFWGPCWKEVSQ